MKIAILFDNRPNDEGFPTLWGFSSFVEMVDGKILFDTGSNGRVLLQNMALLGIDPATIDALFLSHPHWDHIGGVDSVLEVHPDLRLFVSSSFSKHLIRDLENSSLGVEVVGNSSTRLFGQIYSTGTMGEIGEQALVIDRGDSLVVLTGCAHPGIKNTASKSLEMLKKPIELLMGGFHLMDANQEHIANVIEKLRSLGVENVCPTHCSGDMAIEMFQEAFKDRFIAGGVGRVITL